MKFIESEDGRWGSGVYIITNTVDRQVYVGKTFGAFYERYKGHRTSLLGGYHENPLLQTFVFDHSLKCLEFRALEKCESRFARSRELYHIEQYASVFQGYGFNISYGGLDLRRFGKEYVLNYATFKKYIKISDTVTREEMNQVWRRAPVPEPA